MNNAIFRPMVNGLVNKNLLFIIDALGFRAGSTSLMDSFSYTLLRCVYRYALMRGAATHVHLRQKSKRRFVFDTTTSLYIFHLSIACNALRKIKIERLLVRTIFTF